jgi:hypothetical protein
MLFMQIFAAYFEIRTKHIGLCRAQSHRLALHCECAPEGATLMLHNPKGAECWQRSLALTEAGGLAPETGPLSEG